MVMPTLCVDFLALVLMWFNAQVDWHSSYGAWSVVCAHRPGVRWERLSGDANRHPGLLLRLRDMCIPMRGAGTHSRFPLPSPDGSRIAVLFQTGSLPTEYGRWTALQSSFDMYNNFLVSLRHAFMDCTQTIFDCVVCGHMWYGTSPVLSLTHWDSMSFGCATTRARRPARFQRS